jgi:hypothetical protein
MGVLIWNWLLNNEPASHIFVNKAKEGGYVRIFGLCSFIFVLLCLHVMLHWFLFFLGVVPIFWHNYSVYRLVFLLLCFV